MGAKDIELRRAPKLNVVGQSVSRRDGLGHVTGQTVYIDDLHFPGMLHLKMVRSPLHHALIKGIDFSEAEKVPGFVCALTAKDVPKNIYTILCLIGVGPDDEPVLAEKRVRFKGEQIAAIVAETEEAAMQAASKVKLDLEELPAVFDMEEALKPGAPIVTDWDTNYFVLSKALPRPILLWKINIPPAPSSMCPAKPPAAWPNPNRMVATRSTPILRPSFSAWTTRP
jgi:xanthine dehydrogenase molybdopterin-binding subunit B